VRWDEYPASFIKPFNSSEDTNLELDEKKREVLEEIKSYLKEDKNKKWPITIKLIHDFHEIWKSLYGPLWNPIDTATELGYTIQVVKDALTLMKFRAIYPDIIRIKNKKYALHIVRTYDTSPHLLMMKIAQEIQRYDGIPMRITRNAEYRKETYT